MSDEWTYKRAQEYRGWRRKAGVGRCVGAGERRVRWQNVCAGERVVWEDGGVWDDVFESGVGW